MEIVGVLNDLTQKNGGVYEYTQARILSYKNDSISVIELDLGNRKTGVWSGCVWFLQRALIVILFHLGLSFIGRRLFRLDLDNFNRIHIPYTCISPLIFYDTPLVFTLHDVQDKLFPRYFTFWERMYRNIVTRQCLKKACIIECEAEHVRKDISRFYNVDEKKIKVKPIPPLSYFTTGIQKVALEKFERKKSFIYPAKNWPHKNHLRLLEAWEKFISEGGEGNLILTGVTPDDFDEIDLPENVVCLGRLDRKDLDSALEQCLAVVMPSLYESISIPVLEGQMARTLVLASNIDGVRIQLGRDSRVLFNPIDIDEICSKFHFVNSLSNLEYKRLIEFQLVCFTKVFNEN